MKQSRCVPLSAFSSAHTTNGKFQTRTVAGGQAGHLFKMPNRAPQEIGVRVLILTLKNTSVGLD